MRWVGPSWGARPARCIARQQPDERFYACAWLPPLDGAGPQLLFAGERGVIRAADPARLAAPLVLTGHGGAINEMRMHPVDPSLLFSASNDHSVRLWNVRKGVCVAIFGGVEGHRDSVLSVVRERAQCAGTPR